METKIEIKIEPYVTFYKKSLDIDYTIASIIKKCKTVKELNETIEDINNYPEFQDYRPIEKYDEELDLEIQKQDAIGEIVMRLYKNYVTKVALAETFTYNDEE